jgi:CoA:oxalate CoA-transferase
MMSSMLSLSVYNAGLYFMTGQSPIRTGSRHRGVVPYGRFASANGHVLLSTFSDRSWKKIVEALDRPELADDPRFGTARSRTLHRAECEALVTQIFARFTSDELVRRLGLAGIPCGVVRSLGDALEAERTNEAGAIVDVEYPALAGTIPAVRIPIKFDGQWCPARPAPELGSDNERLARYRK